MPTDGLTLTELAALTDVPARTIRYYIAQGLLPAPGREGPSTRYDEAFIARLRLIKQLRASHLPLAEIRARLAALSDEETIALTETPAPEPPDSALDYVRGLLGGPPQKLAQATLAEAMSPPYDAVAPADRAAEPSGSPLLRRIESALPSAPPPAAPAPPPASAVTTSPTPERSQWERIVLEPDVELHVRRPLTRHQNKRVERLVAFARELHEGDKP